MKGEGVIFNHAARLELYMAAGWHILQKGSCQSFAWRYFFALISVIEHKHQPSKFLFCALFCALVWDYFFVWILDEQLIGISILLLASKLREGRKNFRKEYTGHYPKQLLCHNPYVRTVRWQNAVQEGWSTTASELGWKLQWPQNAERMPLIKHGSKGCIVI